MQLQSADAELDPNAEMGAFLFDGTFEVLVEGWRRKRGSAIVG